MKKLLSLLAIFLIVLSCSSDETSTPVVPPPAPIAKYTISFSAGDGGTVSTTGGEYEEGQTVSVTATPQGEYLFTGWSDGNTDATRTITVNSNSTLTANFEKRKYALTLNFVGEGEVTEEIVNAGRTTEYDSGSTVKLTAEPAGEWVFVGWTGDVESTENPIQVAIGEPKEITATFEKKKYPLTVNIEGEGEVLEEIVNAGRTTDYDSGTTVKLTATPEDEWIFTGWSGDIGDIDPTENPIQLNITESKTVSATFEKKKYPLTVNIEGEGEVLEEIVNTGKTTDYDSGTTVKLTAVPADGWEFDGWTGAIESDINPAQLLVTQVQSVTAIFNDDLKQSVLGKWDFDTSSTSMKGNQTANGSSCKILSITFNSNMTFKMYTEGIVLLGGFSISNNSIQLRIKDKIIGVISKILVNGTSLSANFNLNEYCVEASSANKDVRYSEGITYIPDDGLEQFLVDNGYDEALDDFVKTTNINSMKDLFINDTNKYIIHSLEGIEDFLMLESIRIPYNNLSNVNLSYNLKLSSVDFRRNNIEAINFPESKSITNLDLVGNKLTTLDENSLLNVKRLLVGQNELLSLNIISLKELQSLTVDNIKRKDWNFSNNLKIKLLYSSFEGSVNVSMLSELENLKAYGSFEEIDLTKNNKLNYLEIDAPIKSINFSNNTLLKSLQISNSKLKRIDVSSLNLTQCFLQKNIELDCIKTSLDQLERLSRPNGGSDLDGNAFYWEKDSSSNYLLNCDVDINSGEDELKKSFDALRGTGTAGHGGYFSLQSVSSDEMAITRKGGDWYDNGIWIDIHRHNQKVDNGPIKDTWDGGYNAISKVNNIIKNGKLGLNQLAQSKVLRAYLHWRLLDMFGRIRYVDENSISDQLDRKDGFERIENELLSALGVTSISSDISLRGSYLNKNNNKYNINQFAALGILTKLYLNAEVYTGTPRWQEAYYAADYIISKGSYRLSDGSVSVPNPSKRPNVSTDAERLTGYSAIFSPVNYDNPEIIWSVEYDEATAGGMNFHQMTLHYASQYTYLFQDQPWNGYAALEEFYNSYEDGDKRKENNFIVGPQYDYGGNVIVDLASNSVDPSLNYTPFINELEPNAGRTDGARLGKFAFKNFARPDLDNDYPIIRLGDVYLMRAEAKARAAGNWSLALPDVNTIRARAGVSNLGSITAEEFLAERGREMFMESSRRTDLIRFGKWGDSWWEKPNSDTYRIVMPIPIDIIQNSNGSMTQNPGY